MVEPLSGEVLILGSASANARFHAFISSGIIARASANCFVTTCGIAILNNGLCALRSLLFGIGFRRKVDIAGELSGVEELTLPWFWLGFLVLGEEYTSEGLVWFWGKSR